MFREYKNIQIWILKQPPEKYRVFTMYTARKDCELFQKSTFKFDHLRLQDRVLWTEKTVNRILYTVYLTFYQTLARHPKEPPNSGSVHPVETFSSSFTGTTPGVQRRSFAREWREKNRSPHDPEISTLSRRFLKIKHQISEKMNLSVNFH